MATLNACVKDAPSRHIDIDGGTPEHVWQACGKLEALPAVELCELAPARSRAVILAPHPDDETLGCGGLIGSLAALGRQVSVVAVSDGEGSHPQESKLHARLPEMRARESLSALRHLGLGDAAIQHVCIPDGAVTAYLPELKKWLRAYLHPTDILFAPWRLDGHPDHEAAGHAANEMEQEIGCKLVEVPIWTWHWARPDDSRLPWGRARSLHLTPSAERSKRLAMQCYRSQIAEDEGRMPVLPANVLAHFVRPYEVFFL
ncbi:PIG-L deacetylase family protein [Herbaspirillum sp. SJZ099]|uniref:PIG-L deacetylase family protein n=1 Tax=Herbaspirillum sp. SJZ099 TaxID=2572916 RepID=UPI0011A79778|nr:PIG-L family deacetylase [Herbaspirillum sp. SJZ099]TWC69953.1 LmbE family N-acetylglucosaminyl deacetylase [Herbaspirillum sp. SJZ099]